MRHEALATASVHVWPACQPHTEHRVPLDVTVDGRTNPSFTNSPNANDTSSGGSQSPLATRPLSEQRSGPHLHPLALVSAWNPLLQPRPWSQDCPAEGGECPAGWGLCPVTSSVTPSIFTSSCLCSERRGPQHSVKDSGLRHVHRPGSHTAGCALAALCVHSTDSQGMPPYFLNAQDRELARGLLRDSIM